MSMGVLGLRSSGRPCAGAEAERATALTPLASSGSLRAAAPKAWQAPARAWQTNATERGTLARPSLRRCLIGVQ